MCANKTAKAVEAEQAESTSNELDTLRDIVFGQANRDIQKQLQALREHMDQSFDQFQQNLAKQVSLLQQHLERSEQAFAQQLQQLDQKHEDAEQALQQYADKLSSELEMSDTNSRQDADELHQRVDKEVTALTEKYDAKFVETLAKLEQVTQELSSTKTDRKTLAKLLATMAVNLETDD